MRSFTSSTELLRGQTDGALRQEPFTHRQTQAAVERLYDSLLSLEQSNREAPSQDDPESRSMW